MSYLVQAIRRGRKRLGILIGLVALASCSHEPVQDIALLNGGDGEGIGGTGIQGDEGIGGTGVHDGEAIGGTFIIGIVSDTDNFTINGRSVEIDDETTVEIDGRLASQSDLRPGQMAMVEAGGGAGSLKAGHIAIRHEVVGPVARVSRDGTELLVLDQRITLSPDARGSTRQNVGDWVAVSGLRVTSRKIDGTRIDRLDPRRTVHVYGRYGLNRADKVRPVRVANMSVAGLPPERALAGREVLLQGRLEEGRLVASQLKPLDRSAAAGQLETFSIAAYVNQADDRLQLFGFSLSGLASRFSRTTSGVDDGGRLVIIDGRLAKTSDGIEIEQMYAIEDPFQHTPEDYLVIVDGSGGPSDKWPENVDIENIDNLSGKEAKKRLEKQKKREKEAAEESEKQKKEAVREAKKQEKQAARETKKQEKRDKKDKKKQERQTARETKKQEKRDKKDKKSKKDKKV